jgi:transcriptional regulator with XRE-family HTH domain
MTHLHAVQEPDLEAEQEYRRRIARRLIAQRHRLQLTQQQVADRAGVTRNQLGALERAAATPDAWRLRLIARALGTSLGWVLNEPKPGRSVPRPRWEAPIER